MSLPFIAQYQQMLLDADWYYDFSDDHRVWSRGESERRRLKYIAETGGEEYKALYNKYHKKHFDTDDFAKPYKPPFKLHPKE